MLTKILSHEGHDISNFKIYYDDNLKSFRHRFICSEKGCTKVAICKCYETIDDAILDDDTSYVCNMHQLNEIMSEDVVENAWLILDHLDENSEIHKKITQALDYLRENRDDDEAEERLSELNWEAIKTLSDKDISELINYIDYDYDYDEIIGEACPME